MSRVQHGENVDCAIADSSQLVVRGNWAEGRRRIQRSWADKQLGATAVQICWQSGHQRDESTQNQKHVCICHLCVCDYIRSTFSNDFKCAVKRIQRKQNVSCMASNGRWPWFLVEDLIISCIGLQAAVGISGPVLEPLSSVSVVADSR